MIDIDEHIDLSILNFKKELTLLLKKYNAELVCSISPADQPSLDVYFGTILDDNGKVIRDFGGYPLPIELP